MLMKLLKQAGMKKLEDAEKILSALLTGVMPTTSYQNLHLRGTPEFRSPSCGNTARVETLESSCPEDALTQGTSIPDAKTETTSFQCQTSDLQGLFHHVKTM